MRNEKRNRLQSDIRDPTFKICVPGRIITRSSDIRDPTLKNETEKRPKLFPLSLLVIPGQMVKNHCPKPVCPKHYLWQYTETMTVGVKGFRIVRPQKRGEKNYFIIKIRNAINSLWAKLRNFSLFKSLSFIRTWWSSGLGGCFMVHSMAHVSDTEFEFHPRCLVTICYIHNHKLMRSLRPGLM